MVVGCENSCLLLSGQSCKVVLVVRAYGPECKIHLFRYALFVFEHGRQALCHKERAQVRDGKHSCFPVAGYAANQTFCKLEHTRYTPYLVDLDAVKDNQVAVPGFAAYLYSCACKRIRDPAKRIIRGGQKDNFIVVKRLLRTRNKSF